MWLNVLSGTDAMKICKVLIKSCWRLTMKGYMSIRHGTCFQQQDIPGSRKIHSSFLITNSLIAGRDYFAAAICHMLSKWEGRGRLETGLNSREDTQFIPGKEGSPQKTDTESSKYNQYSSGKAVRQNSIKSGKVTVPWGTRNNSEDDTQHLLKMVGRPQPASTNSREDLNKVQRAWGGGGGHEKQRAW